MSNPDTPGQEVYELSKIRLLGLQFDIKKEWPNIPECVIIDLAMSLGVRITSDQITTHADQIIRVLENTAGVPKWKRTDTMDIMTLQTLAGYVNSDTEIRWTPGPLLAAMDHLLQYYNHTNMIQINAGFVVGHKTPSIPLAYDACLLYIHCRQHLLHVNRSTSMDAIAAQLRLIHLPDMMLRSGVFQRVQSMSRSDMI